MNPQTYWNGERCVATRGTVVVGQPPVATWWCSKLVGERIAVVRVHYGNSTFYLANDDESGWYKVTNGRGSTDVGHRNVPVDDPASFEEELVHV